MLQSPILAIVRGKDLATLLEQAGNAAGQAARTVVCGGGGFLLDNLPAIGPAGRAARELARGIHSGLCGLPTPPALGEPTFPPPPFTGGQCPGVAYRVFGRGTGTFQGNPQVRTLTTPDISGVLGPISIRTTGTGNSTNWQVVSRNAQGGEVITDSLPTEPSAFWSNRDWGIRLIERIDGLPDNCGDPPGGDPIPPPPAPPVPIPPDIDLPVTPDGGGPDVDFTFSPRVGPVFIGAGGGLVIPVNVRINGPNININSPISVPVNISLPGFGISFPGQGGGGGRPDNPAAPTPPGPPPRPIPGPPREVCCNPRPSPGPEIEVEGDEPVEPPGDGRRLIGIRVSCTVNSALGSFTVIGQGGGANNLYLPRLANIYFDVRAENQEGQLLPATIGPIPIQLLTQYVPVPEDVLTVRWRVVRESGVGATVIPFFVPANRT